MMFLDATYLIGLILKRDSLTPISKELEPLIEHEKKLINNVVLTEVLNSLTAINSKYNLDEILKFVGKYKYDYITPEDYNESLKKFRYYNYAVNFSDCTILTSMEKYNVNKIVSFDDDFDKVKGIERIYLTKDDILME